MNERQRDGLFIRLLYPILAIGLLVAVWYPLTIPLRGFLPTPLDVLDAMVRDVQIGDTYFDIWVTMRRILVGFVGSLVLGVGLGVWMGRNKLSEAFFLPWVVVALAIPGPVYIIMSILILGIQESSTLIALVCSVAPYVVNIVFQGVGSLDPRLAQMSRLYHATAAQHFREVVIPELTPSLLAAVRTAFAMSWKLVVVLEALSQPRGIGAQIYHYFRLLQTDQVFAWTFLFTVIMFSVEVVVFQTLERRLLRWRRAVTL